MSKDKRKTVIVFKDRDGDKYTIKTYARRLKDQFTTIESAGGKVLRVYRI